MPLESVESYVSSTVCAGDVLRVAVILLVVITASDMVAVILTVLPTPYGPSALVDEKLVTVGLVVSEYASGLLAGFRASSSVEAFLAWSRIKPADTSIASALFSAPKSEVA